MQCICPSFYIKIIVFPLSTRHTYTAGIASNAIEA